MFTYCFNNKCICIFISLFLYFIFYDERCKINFTVQDNKVLLYCNVSCTLVSESPVCSLHGVSVEFLHHPLVQCRVEHCHLGICCQVLSVVHKIQWIYWQTECLVSSVSEFVEFLKYKYSKYVK